MKAIDKLWAIFTGGQKSTQCEKDKEYLTKRVNTLSRELGTSLGAIEITGKPAGKVTIHDIPPGYDTLCADLHYITYSVEDWINTLAQLHESVSNRLKYEKDVWDCDDFALLYSAVLSYSTYHSGLSNQVAFCIMWSKTHAFNGYVDDQNRVWKFEPQGGRVIGQLGKDHGKRYDVQKIWFMS